MRDDIDALITRYPAGALVTPPDPAGVIAIVIDCEPPYADLALTRIEHALASNVAILLLAPDQRALDLATATVAMLLPSADVHVCPDGYRGPICGMESGSRLTH